MSEPSTTFILGGARSGKSRLAERLCLRSGLKRVYVATGAAWDEEMRERIGLHQQQRGTGWTTIEEQTDLTGVLSRETAPDRVVLVDCLTLWLTNLLLAECDLHAETEQLVSAARAVAGPCVFVSNETGLGIVPDNRLARTFRDAQGRLNQAMADVCTQAVFVAAGQPILLKPRQDPEITL
ncbi:adenosylcobinamide kinase/adenosylcobinamide phosphate guanyltransferase [Roseibium aquae]|uniref:Bifunctional adenosylcobalamin biosynthesis protein n=1 Tax=Roseibium aquae TaxID=1323746 RepID=A0A916TM45_9HYPH|nr:bifunctional adenosylcobinamide kinase/adenosylcobinamide-phosphate guanylyltransferase [Roseibium aquae]GGB54678.1 adenosylcobinamide kinase/adenosylcobinamide phosphate guanyltransferase [Roseibium aquae]